MTFLSREEAGEKLGRHLAQQQLQVDLVLGLPRGGVVVAASVARELAKPLDVLVVRKLGHPQSPEFAIGAIAEADTLVMDPEMKWVAPVDLERVRSDEARRLANYIALFHPRGLPNVEGKSVLLVDDGLATGATMEAGIRSVRKRNAGRSMVAVPVASGSGVERLAAVADQVIALCVDPDFMAVGHYYLNFAQVTDAEVADFLGLNPQ